MVIEHKYHIINGKRRDASLFGAFPDTGEILFELSLDICDILSVKLVIHSDGLADSSGEKYAEYSLYKCDDTYTAQIKISDFSALSSNGLLYYRYDVVTSSSVVSFGGEEVTDLLPQNEYGDRQLLIYDKDFATPSFMKGGEIYHIFVDRFAASGKYPLKKDAKINNDWTSGVPEFAEYRGAPIKNNEFFGGDLAGVAEHLDYIASLGVNVLYLSPVFDSPSNHKYDTADYMKVDSMFGGDKALEELIKKCRDNGISVVLDGVFNHTGADSKYFDLFHRYGDTGAYNNKDSEYFKWYNFRKYPDDYECWWNIKILPRVKSECESFRDYILGDGGVVDKYMQMGISGFRLDVVDELSDIFIENLRDKLKLQNRESVVIGEVWEDASNKIAYSNRRKYLGGKQLDSVMNYPLREGVISFIKYGDHETLKHALEIVYRHYPKCVSDVLMNFLGTHDTERIITVLAGEPDEGKTPAELSVMTLSESEREKGRKLVKCAWSLVSTAYGVPSIFYGDEAGLEGYHDPFCRRPFPWGREDSELEDFYTRIGMFRKNEAVFKEGLFRVVHSGDNEFVTERFDDSESVFTVVTRDKPYRFDIGTPVKCVFDSDVSNPDTSIDLAMVPPYTARIFKK